MASTDTAYHQEETVTGTRVPRKTPQGVQSADGDSIRNQRSLGPTTGSVSRSMGSDR